MTYNVSRKARQVTSFPLSFLLHAEKADQVSSIFSSASSFKATVIQAPPTQISCVVFVDNEGKSAESAALVALASKASEKAPHVKFYQVDIQAVADAASKLRTDKPPVAVLYRGGEKKKVLQGGVGGPDLKAAIEEVGTLA